MGLVFEAVINKETVPSGFVRPIMEHFASSRQYVNVAQLAGYIGETEKSREYVLEHVYGFMDRGELEKARQASKQLVNGGYLTILDIKDLFSN